MEVRLSEILRQMRVFAMDAAAFLGSPVAVVDLNGSRNLIPVSNVLESVARKLQDIGMTVRFSPDCNKSSTASIDWSKDVTVDDQVETTHAVKPERDEGTASKNETSDNSEKSGNIDSKRTENENACEVNGMKSETKGDVEDSGREEKLPLVEVTVDVGWKEDGTQMPRLMTFTGSGVSYGDAKNDAAAQALLYFGLRDEEFEILRVG